MPSELRRVYGQMRSGWSGIPRPYAAGWLGSCSGDSNGMGPWGCGAAASFLCSAFDLSTGYEMPVAVLNAWLLAWAACKIAKCSQATWRGGIFLGSFIVCVAGWSARTFSEECEVKQGMGPARGDLCKCQMGLCSLEI
jgi:hypothetical protein